MKGGRTTDGPKTSFRESVDSVGGATAGPGEMGGNTNSSDQQKNEDTTKVSKGATKNEKKDFRTRVLRRVTQVFTGKVNVDSHAKSEGKVKDKQLTPAAAAAAVGAPSSAVGSASASACSNTEGEKVGFDMATQSKRRESRFELLTTKSLAFGDPSMRTIYQLVTSPQHKRHSMLMSGIPIKGKQEHFETRGVDMQGDLPDWLGFEGTDTGEVGFGWSCRKGIKPDKNQDDFCFYILKDLAIIGLFDGHGPCGDEVAAYAKSILPEILFQHWDLYTDPNKAIEDAFTETNKRIGNRSIPGSQFDASLSGTTATLLIYKIDENRVHIGHVGDSRCVAGYKQDGKLKIQKLTKDHKPESAKEIIEAAGGEVRQPEGDLSWRVYVKDQPYPGISMWRSLGDTVGHLVGMTHVPDIVTLDVSEAKDEGTRFFIIATDGLWEVVKPKVAVSVIDKHQPNKVQDGVDELAKITISEWNRLEKGAFADDQSILAFHPYRCKSGIGRALKKTADLERAEGRD